MPEYTFILKVTIETGHKPTDLNQYLHDVADGIVQGIPDEWFEVADEDMLITQVAIAEWSGIPTR